MLRAYLDHVVIAVSAAMTAWAVELVSAGLAQGIRLNLSETKVLVPAETTAKLPKARKQDEVKLLGSAVRWVSRFVLCL